MGDEAVTRGGVSENGGLFIRKTLVFIKLTGLERIPKTLKIDTTDGTQIQIGGLGHSGIIHGGIEIDGHDS
jgi:hypothetical protein